MSRTPKSEGGNASAASSSFLHQLKTLREFVTGMGMNNSEAEMSTALRGSGYNVELALERLLNGGVEATNASDASINTKSHHAHVNASSAKKRRSNSTTPSKSSAIKRTKSSPVTSHSNVTSAAAPSKNQLLLCKRWTVSCSKTIRGKISYGETCSFDENYKSAVNGNNSKVTPMVRFRTKNAEGTLNRYLCEILGPLLRLPATNIVTSGSNTAGTETPFIPMIYLSAEALMEDNYLKIGSDIPINLKIFLNDPVAFFNLFQHDSTSGKSESSQFFGRKNNVSKKNGKKYEVTEAAFRLLQWAERGEEIDYGIEDGGTGNSVQLDMSQMKESAEENKKADNDDASSTSSATKDLVLENNADGDYEGEPESEEVSELNQLVVDPKKASKSIILELPDPTGFKDGVVLRPYQRQALYWMCRREGLTLEQLKVDGKDGISDGEIDLLAELASSMTHSSSGLGDVQMLGGNGIACDCGPVVVGDDALASSAVPVVDYEKTTDLGRKYVHHPLWKRRYLANKNLTTVYAFYVNELLGIASASPPNPPKQCVGGILADQMGLGKTVMLMSLILQSKTIELESSKSIESEAATIVDIGSSNTAEEVVDMSSDEKGEDEDYVEQDEPQLKVLGDATSRSCGTTLVIAPLSLVSQWEEEMATKTSLTSVVYYDNASKKLVRGEAFSSVDVVVTTYGTIQSEYAALSRATKDGGSRKPGASQPLLTFEWKRIILDEAHGIKNPSTVVSKACCLLRSESRWCVTGTPIQNSLQDIYGLLKFLRHEPWCEASFWKNAITSAIPDKSTGSNIAGSGIANSAPDIMSVAFGRVRRVLSPIILRRTKDTLSEDGTPILTLPPIDSAVVSVNLTKPEREFYNALLERSQSVFEGHVKAGTAAKSWFAIFSLLQRLRQACDHVSLTVKNKFDESEIEFESDKVTSEGAVSDKFLTDLLSKFKTTAFDVHRKESTSFAKEVAAGLTQSLESNEDSLQNECPICLEEPKIADCVHTPCAHMFCKKCLMDEFREQQKRGKKGSVTMSLDKKSCEFKIEGGDCPVCHARVKLRQVIEVKKSENGELISTYLNDVEKENHPCPVIQQRDEAAREALENSLMRGSSSSKLEAILNELDAIWKVDPGSKILVFSQFLGFLDIITRSLHRRNITTYRIDGKVSLKDRVKTIDKFNKDSKHDSSQRGSVFLVSMKAGGCGLNLVAASTVFIIDPWWNQAIEDQCIMRIHRIGQKAEVVRVRKFVVQDSVEEKIVKLQFKKKNMANDILDRTDSSGLDSSKPTLEDFKLIFGS